MFDPRSSLFVVRVIGGEDARLDLSGVGPPVDYRARDSCAPPNGTSARSGRHRGTRCPGGR